MAKLVPLPFAKAPIQLRTFQPDTLKCLTMFAGEPARDLVLQHMNGLENVMNLESNAHSWYNGLRWGIKASHRGWGGTSSKPSVPDVLIKAFQVKYIYRRVPYSPEAGPASINPRDGDEIHFGDGEEAKKLGGGPLPLLCNVQLAVARVMHMSGAAEVIIQPREEC